MGNFRLSHFINFFIKTQALSEARLFEIEIYTIFFTIVFDK